MKSPAYLARCGALCLPTFLACSACGPSDARTPSASRGADAAPARTPAASSPDGAVTLADAQAPREASSPAADAALDARAAPEAGALADAGPASNSDAASEASSPVRFACAEQSWKLSKVDVGALTLEVACRAPASATGPLALLLHGYPESHLAWNALATLLVARGFVVVAPNQRGYAGSDKPEPVEAYHIDRATEDLLGVLNASGRTRMLLIGHDWGGLVSFVFAHRHPQRVQGLVVMNGPHPDIWGQRQVDPVQADATDGYVPLIMGPLGFVAPFYLDFSLSPHLTADELPQYRAQWSQPDAFTHMNKWYAANLHPDVKLPRGISVEVPTLAIWGADDAFVTPSELDHLPDYVRQLEMHKLVGVDHWVTHQRTDEVFELIRAFHARLP